MFHTLSNRELLAEKNYWKKFYRQFTDYLYDALDLYDGYVGSVIKNIHLLFNYLMVKKQLLLGQSYCERYINGHLYEKGYYASSLDILKRYVKVS